MRRLWAFVFVLLLLAGCAGRPSSRVRLATAATAYDTGLLTMLKPRFEAAYGHKLEILVLGTGQALATAARGDADVVLTHDPEAEQRFIAAGHGADRRPLMHNYFMLVGPETDPAGIKGHGAVEALRRITAQKVLFVSRADDSGTHKRELGLWKAASVQPHGGSYVQSGTGQAETLQMASQKQGYALTDEGTFWSLQGKLRLVAHVQNDPLLYNPYSVIAVTKPGVHRQGAADFIQFLTSPDTQKLIGAFGTEANRRPYFRPGHKE